MGGFQWLIGAGLVVNWPDQYAGFLVYICVGICVGYYWVDFIKYSENYINLCRGLELSHTYITTKNVKNSFEINRVIDIKDTK